MSSTSDASDTCLLLELPREVRDQILGEVFFPGEKEPEDLTQNIYGLGSTAVRQINPYNTDKPKKPHFDISVITTCRQLQHEAEGILYGSSSWNLMYQDWGDPEKLSYEVFAKFPTRLRRLIQRVERKCYSAPYSETISLWDWKAFMTFLAQECPNLHSLRLWGPGDRFEGPPWVETCNRDADLAIPSSWTVKSRNPQFLDRQVIESYDSEAPFPFLQLPRIIRNRIYRHVLLPPDKRLHPYLKSWYDKTTRNAIPLFLTSKQIHIEAESVLYSHAIFTSPCLAKYDRRLSCFLGGKIRDPASGLHPRLLSLIKNLSFGWSKVGSVRLFSIIGRSMQLDYLELILSEDAVRYINDEWRARAVNPRALWRAGYASDFTMQAYARVPNLVIRTPQGSDLEPECFEWWTHGLREELLRPSGDPKLAWLHTKAERMLSSRSVNCVPGGGEASKGSDESIDVTDCDSDSEADESLSE